MRLLSYVAMMAVSAFLLSGCANMLGLSEEQTQAALQRALELHQSGQLSDAELDAFKTVLARQESFDWEELLWSAGSIVGALFGVQIWRGGVNNRKGAVPSA